MAIALTTAPLQTGDEPRVSKYMWLRLVRRVAPPRRFVVFCPHQVEDIYELRVCVWIAWEIIGGFGSFEGEDGRDGVEWRLVEEEYGPVFEMSLCTIWEHEVG